MALPDILFRAKLAVHEAIDRAQRLFLSPQTRIRPRRELELRDLEDRILLSAVPAAMIGETLDAAPLDPAAGDLAQSESAATGVAEVARLQEPANAGPNSGETGDEEDAAADGSSDFGSLQDSGALQTPAVSPAAEDVRHELVFIDTSATDYQQLLDDLWALDDDGRELDVVLLSNQRDGIDQISEALAGHTDLDAIHVVSHGSDGAVKLGSIQLNLDCVGAYAGQLVTWRDALATDSDLMIYGCDLAATDDGQLLVESLAALIEADVAEQPDSLSIASSPAPAPSTTNDSNRDNTATSDPETEFLAVPLSFEQNAGQTDSQVDFLARGSGYSVFLTEGDAVLALSGNDTSHVVRLDLVDANPSPGATGEDLLASYSNYLFGSDPDAWQTDVSQYGSVVYDNIYDGVDLRYYGNQRQLEYDFLVAAGADANQIRLNFDGTQDVRIDTNGELVLRLNENGDEIRFKAPYSYQTAADGTRETVASQYVIHADGSVGFELAAYDTARELVIDPVLDYMTFVGGTGYDTVEGIAADDSGNVYITGYCGSADMPTTVGALDRTYNGGSYDIYVAKLNPDGSTLVYSTFIGGTGNDVGHAIAVDSSGNAYVTGFTTSSGMSTGNAYQGTMSGAGDAVLLKLNSTGTALLYSTYFGGSEATWSETAFDLALDSSGMVYITGSTYSTDLPLKNAYDGTLGGTRDAFVAKFDLSQSGAASLLYSSYFGGSGADYAKTIAVDSTGAFTIAGYADSADLTTLNAYQPTSGGGADAFVTRFNSSGSAVTYSTYLGGTGSDWVEAIAVDNTGKIYAGGDTDGGFPTTVGAYDTTYAGSDEGFVIKIDPTLSGSSSAVYSTYIGSGAFDYVIGLDVDDSGVAYITGFTGSSGFPTTGDGFDRVMTGANDGFFAVLNETGTALTYSTFLGGDGQDRGKDVVWNAATGAAYVGGPSGGSTGWSGSPTQLGAGGDRDAFVAKFTFNPVNTPPTVALNNTTTTLAENTDTTGGLKVADIVVTDDGLGTNDLSLSGTDASLFEIVGSELRVKDGATLDFETKSSYDVTVEVDDATIPGDPDDSVAFNLPITDVNEAPTVSLSNLVPSLAEDTDTTGTVRVADIVVTDDALGAESLSLSGADAADFVIVGNELHLAAGTSLDFESKSSYDVTVEVDDATILGDPDDSVAFNLSITDVNEAPTVSLSNLVPSLAEDTDTTGTVRVADIVITDDALGAESLSLSGADAADFLIVGNELHLAAGTSLDFETKSSYDVTVEVDDATIPGDPDDSVAFNLSISDVNEAPTVSLSNLVPSLAEDTDTTGTVRVADIVITDDALGAESLSLSGADTADFVIVGNELHLAAGTSLDFETQNSYDVTVEVDDATIPGDPDDSVAFNLSITDVNEAPTVSLTNTVITLAEDADTTSRIKVADIVVADDALGTNGLALSGADAALFEIDADVLYLKAGTVLDRIGNPTLDVTIEVDDIAVGASPDDTDVLSITVTDVNTPPTVSLTNTVPSLAEDTDTTGAVRVADIAITDDGTGTNDLTLSGADAGDFEIVGNELRLKAGTSLDFESKSGYDVTVEVDDAAIPGDPDDSEAFNLSITDVNEAPTVSLSNLMPSLAEDTDTTGTVRVADIVVTDDALGAESLSLSGTDAADFVIVGNELHLAAGTSLDFESHNSYDVTVEVDDATIPGDPDDLVAFNLSITDVNEAPTVSLSNLVPALAEDTDTTGTVRVADIVVTDDALGAESLSLSGADAADFVIVGNELHLAAGTTLDFESHNSYDVTVEVDDAAIPGDPDDSAAFNLAITDVNEAPTVSLSNLVPSLAEDTDTTGTVRVADIVVTDDALGAESLSLSGADAADFVIVGNELHLAAGTSLDFESQNSYDVTVEVDDATIPGDPDDSVAFNLAITDVNEAPTVSLSNLVPSLAEDTDTTGTVRVADIVVTDDALGAESLSLSGADAADFVIVGNELHLAAGTSLDFESKSGYDVTVEVDDATIPGDPDDSVAFNLSITDVNEAPTVSLSNLVPSLAEDTDTTGTVRVADIVVTDDALGAESLSLSGADAADFVIVGNELHLAAGTSLDFESKSSYDVTVEVDDATIPGDPDDSVAFNLAITDVNEAPVLDLDANNSSGQGGADFATTFTEHGGPVTVADGDATVSDPENATLESLTVTITNLLDGAAESLAADTSGTSISASYDSATGVLTLSGADTIVSYQQVLRTISYANSSQNPDTTDRMLQVVANDGLADSNLGTTTLEVVAENDAPVNTVPGPQVTAEDTPLVFSTAGGNPISIGDVDAGSNPVVVTLSVTNGTLTLPSTTGLIFGHGDGVADATMTFVGTIAEIDNALEGLRFDPAPDYFGPAIIQITVNDQGHIGAGGTKTDLDTIPITVTPVNDVPVASDATFALAEHSPAGTGVGTVSATDADPADSLTYRIAGGSGSGVFGVDPVSGEITVVDPAVLVYETRPTFDLAVEVEDSAAATGTATVTISLINVNQPPAANSDSYTVDQGRPLTVVAPGVLVNDTDPDGGTLTAVLVTSTTHGTLTLGGDGTLSYAPDARFYGTDAFTYRLTDSLEQSGPATVTIEVRPLSLPPADEPPHDEPPAEESDPGDESSDEEDSLPATSEMLPRLDHERMTDRQLPTPAGPLEQPAVAQPAPVSVEDSGDPAWLQNDLSETVTRKAAADAAAHTDGEDLPQPSPPADHGERNAPAQESLLWNQLDAFQEDLLADLDSEQDVQTLIVGASAVGVTGLTVGYVVWLLHGGALLATIVSTLPAWASFDPLPVLESFEASAQGRREDEDISFESLVTGT